MATIASWWEKKEAKMPRRVHWKAHEKEWLAKQVGKDLIAAGLDPLTHDVSREALQSLRNAISKLEHTKRRYIGGLSQAKWLMPLLEEMFRAYKQLPSKYSPDVFNDNQPTEQDEPLAEEETYEGEPQPSYTLVSEQDWRRLNRLLRINQRQVQNLGDTVETLTQLLLEAAPHLAPQEVKPPVERHDEVSTQVMPLVVVAGLRERDYHHVQDKVGHFAELVFVDTRKRQPEKLGECDWLVMTRFSGESWIKRGLHIYKGRASVVNSLSGVVREIERVCNV